MRVGILKPIATAFAIGTGGPFGAEGAIIQTAAFGFLFGQLAHMTPHQRRISLAAGRSRRYGGCLYCAAGRHSGSD